MYPQFFTVGPVCVFRNPSRGPRVSELQNSRRDANNANALAASNPLQHLLQYCAILYLLGVGGKGRVRSLVLERCSNIRESILCRFL